MEDFMRVIRRIFRDVDGLFRIVRWQTFQLTSRAWVILETTILQCDEYEKAAQMWLVCVQ